MNTELNGFIAAAKSIAYDAQTLFGGLTERQLNWQPDPKSWSVGLCLEHLIKTNDEILGGVESRIRGTRRQTIFERMAVGSNFFGNYILKAVQPENKSKLKAPKVFKPATSSVSADIVNKFVANQERIIELMRASEELDLARTIVASPAASFVTYSLFNVYKIVVTHERRHFRQAQNVMKLPEFPKA